MGYMKRVLLALAVAVVAAVAGAEPTTPAEALNVATVATDGVADLTGLVGDALPYITAAIGLGIVIRWARRIFKF